MTVTEVLTAVDEIKPNAFSTAAKLRWLNQLELRIATEVFLLAPAELPALDLVANESGDWELLVGAPYEDIYEIWLATEIDQHNAEYTKRANTTIVFDDRWRNFAAWFANMYEPASGYLVPAGGEEGN